jgi:hypothetical protein
MQSVASGKTHVYGISSRGNKQTIKRSFGLQVLQLLDFFPLSFIYLILTT